MPKRRKSMPMQEGAVNSASLGEPSQPERPCSDPSNQERNRSERNFVQSSCFTMEDVRREVREESERVLSQWAKNFQSFMESALKEMVQEIRSFKNPDQAQTQRVELENNHSPHLGRANAKSTGENVGRNLRLQIQTKVPDILFTENKLEGEGGARISVALIDANTGEVVRTGLESSAKLDVVVLKGGFKKDDDDNWTKEEFENQLAKVREKKGWLLRGDLQLTLREGVGELGELIFKDNSRSVDTETFRIGLKVASGCCENTRIREGITNAFAVREHRGESSKKNYPPALDDELWRLERIAKGGVSYQKLASAGIHKVQDFLLLLHCNPKKLRDTLGNSIKQKHWECLIKHAKTCKGWSFKANCSNGMSKHAAVFNTDRQPTGLIGDIYHLATDRPSAQEKEPEDTIVKEAPFDNWNDVGDSNGETFSTSMLKNSSQFIGGQIGNRIPSQYHFCATSVGREALPVNVGFPVEGHYNVVTARPSQVQSQNTNYGDAMELAVDGGALLAATAADGLNGQFSQVTSCGPPIRSPYIIPQDAMRSQMPNPCRQTESTLNGPPFAPTSSLQRSGTLPCPGGGDVVETLQFDGADDPINYFLPDNHTSF